MNHGRVARPPVGTSSLARHLSLTTRHFSLEEKDGAFPLPVGEDGSLAIDLRLDKMGKEDARNEATKRLVQTLKQVVDSGCVVLLPTKTLQPEDSIQAALQGSEGRPAVVPSPDGRDLIGILTPFDLL